jgi:hypothetical protein
MRAALSRRVWLRGALAARGRAVAFAHCERGAGTVVQ